jgi:hypothetical protein
MPETARRRTPPPPTLEPTFRPPPPVSRERVIDIGEAPPEQTAHADSGVPTWVWVVGGVVVVVGVAGALVFDYLGDQSE